MADGITGEMIFIKGYDDGVLPQTVDDDCSKESEEDMRRRAHLQQGLGSYTASVCASCLDTSQKLLPVVGCCFSTAQTRKGRV